MTSTKATDAVAEKDVSQNTMEQPENLEPWNMFTSNLVTPKMEPDDPDVSETIVPEKDLTVIPTFSTVNQTTQFITPKIEPEDSGSDEESSCRMDCTTSESAAFDASVTSAYMEKIEVFRMKNDFLQLENDKLHLKMRTLELCCRKAEQQKIATKQALHEFEKNNKRMDEAIRVLETENKTLSAEVQALLEERTKLGNFLKQLDSRK